MRLWPVEIAECCWRSWIRALGLELGYYASTRTMLVLVIVMFSLIPVRVIKVSMKWLLELMQDLAHQQPTMHQSTLTAKPRTV